MSVKIQNVLWYKGSVTKCLMGCVVPWELTKISDMFTINKMQIEGKSRVVMLEFKSVLESKFEYLSQQSISVNRFYMSIWPFELYSNVNELLCS